MPVARRCTLLGRENPSTGQPRPTSGSTMRIPVLRSLVLVGLVLGSLLPGQPASAGQPIDAFIDAGLPPAHARYEAAGPSMGPGAQAAQSASPSPAGVSGAPEASADPTACERPASSQPVPAPIDASAFDGYAIVDQPDGGQVLHVGRFDGRTSAALRSDGEIAAAGPSSGEVLAATARGRRSVEWLIDTATGSKRVLRRDPRPIVAVAIDREAGQWFWVTTRPDQSAALWRAPLAGGPPVRIAGPREAHASFLTSGTGRVAWWGLGPQGTFAVVFDAADGSLTDVEGVTGDVVGFLGDDLVWYGGGGSELGYPLRAFDPSTGASRDVATGDGYFATIASDAQGGDVLVTETIDPDGTALYVAMDASGTDSRLRAGPTAERWIQRATPWQGYETPGYLPVVPDGRFPGGDMAADWVLIPLDGGAPVTPSGPTPTVSPPPTASAAP